MVVMMAMERIRLHELRIKRRLRSVKQMPVNSSEANK